MFKKHLQIQQILLVLSTLPISIVSHSEIIRDNTTGIGPSNIITNNDNTYTITQNMGDTLGQTLLHSFDVFNINTGETANFTGDASIQNIISRVTGNGLSTIYGSINSSISGANFYFINPNGIIIGPNGTTVPQLGIKRKACPQVVIMLLQRKRYHSEDSGFVTS